MAVIVERAIEKLCASRRTPKKAVHGILLVYKNLKYRVHLCADYQTEMNRAKVKQFQRSARVHKTRVTERQSAQSISVNLRNVGEVEDDIHNLRFCERDNHSTQDCFRITRYKGSSQIENPNPVLFAL
ncbi:MAG: hypothetical protein ABSF12_20160, partial [Bryobacteraceae bacterium]